ncbi:MAG TPA: hypothetical protein VFH31_11330 [Pyrinomonadaceae bacterium]|nr:hypothetical protein [Pyrinomonadaceae bacterium]
MNAKTRTVMTLVAVMLMLGLFFLERTTSAQSPNSKCRQVKGDISDVSNPTGATGVLTNGGILNGTTELVANFAHLPTPDPTTSSYTNDFTITTEQGQLKTSNVGLFDVGILVFTEMARINPNASTGRFAGATGVLFISGNTIDGGATFQSSITGEICFLNE